MNFRFKFITFPKLFLDRLHLLIEIIFFLRFLHLLFHTRTDFLFDLKNLDLRASIAEASLMAGMAFSNTKTAIAHNISYPITLGWGVQHGIACSFTLPSVLRSVIGLGGFREEALREIFGENLGAGADDLDRFLNAVGIGTRFQDHGIPADRWPSIIEDAFAGERGRNFVGTLDRFMATQDALAT